jgi:hypothetical protein
MQLDESSNSAPDGLMRQLDDMDVELEIHSEQMKVIKGLLIVLVILQLPVTALALYFLYSVMNPIPYF